MKKNLIATGLLLAYGLAAADDNVLTLGAGIAATSRYSGSDKLQAAPVLAIDYQMANGFYASTMRGIGYGQNFGRLQLNGALAYRGERTDKEEVNFGGRQGSDKLKGMGVIKGSATAVLGAGLTIMDGLVLGLQAEVPLSHRENGSRSSLGLTYTLLNDQANNVSVSGGANFADKKYAQTYYGVTASQSARSGFKEFAAKAGVFEATFSTSWQHRLNQQWCVTSMLGVSRLTRDAAKSPIVFRKTSPTAAVYASYAF